MNPQHLIRIAKGLADGRIGGRRGRPNQDELRRALSTGYYALFHSLAGAAADLFVGSSVSTRNSDVWVQTYRSLQHGFAKEQCSRIVAAKNNQSKQSVSTFDYRIVDFAETFVAMQELRLEADYNPTASFTRSDVSIRIGAAELALKGFQASPRTERRAFAAFVMHRRGR